MFQAEAEIEAKNWEKRNRDYSFQEINQELETQRFRLNQASRWADQAQRDNISLYGEIHRIVQVLWETFFERPPAQEGQSSIIFNNSKNLASSFQDLRPDTSETARRDMKRESLNTPFQPPHFQSRSGILDHIGGTYSHVGMMDYPRVPITEWNLGKFPHAMEFQSWKLNFKTEV